MSAMPNISYAQNAEDIVLSRLYGTRAHGCYIDVGAAHPVIDSVTKLFYDRGWRGINIEPNPEIFAILSSDRPHDVNLMAALSDRPGEAELHLPIDQRFWGLSTLEAPTADSASCFERTVNTEVMTLALVVEQHLNGRAIDFLKIDVEGHERKVLLGVDWEKTRPRVIIIEAVRPCSTVQNHFEWEELLISAGYCSVLFDGINRFYVRKDDHEAVHLLCSPANTLDGYIRYDHFLALAELNQLQSSVHALHERTSRLVEETQELRDRSSSLDEVHTS